MIHVFCKQIKTTKIIQTNIKTQTEKEKKKKKRVSRCLAYGVQHTNIFLLRALLLFTKVNLENKWLVSFWIAKDS